MASGSGLVNTVILLSGIALAGLLPIWRMPGEQDGISYWDYLINSHNMPDEEWKSLHIPYSEAVEKAQEAWGNRILIY